MRTITELSRPGTYTALGYRSARLSAADGIVVSGGRSGDAAMQYDRGRLIDMSRQFYRDNAIYCGMIRRAVSYIIGNGFTLQMQSRNQAHNEKVESLWREFWRRPEIRGLLSGRRVEKLYCQEQLLCGDSTAIKTNKGLLQLIDAEQVVGKNGLDDGIARDSYGRPTAFYIAKYGQHGQIDRRTAAAYDPRDILFSADPERPSATRGVPRAQAAFPMLHRINDVCDSEAIAWQLLARMAVSMTRQDGPLLAYSEGRPDPDAQSGAGQKDLTSMITDLKYALIFHGEPGDEIRGIDRNLPGQNFPESVRMFLRLLGLPLGLPLEVMLLDWTKTNYSQSRAVLEQAYQTFVEIQLAQEEDLLTPVLLWKIGHWIQQGLLTERAGDELAHSWIAPTFPWIDQLKEVQAYGAQVDRGFTLHGTVCKSLNVDREDLNNAREREIRDAIGRAQQITADTGVAVPWQIFAGMEAPITQPQPQTQSQPQTEEPDDAGDTDTDDE